MSFNHSSVLSLYGDFPFMFYANKTVSTYVCTYLLCNIHNVQCMYMFLLFCSQKRSCGALELTSVNEIQITFINFIKPIHSLTHNAIHKYKPYNKLRHSISHNGKRGSPKTCLAGLPEGPSESDTTKHLTPDCWTVTLHDTRLLTPTPAAEYLLRFHLHKWFIKVELASQCAQLPAWCEVNGTNNLSNSPRPWQYLS